MTLILLGLNHKSAPVSVRERYAVAPEHCSGVLEKLAGAGSLEEAALISTCNRTELIVATRSAQPAAERMYAFFAHEIGDGSAELRHLYELRDAEAVSHLFRVASSLDSMVLGEAQILGQLKLAHRAAVASRSCGPLLNRLFERAFRTAKRVRNETGLGAASVSVARVGVQLAAEVFESLAGKRALLLGAGEMAESALHGLRDAGASDLVILNRTPASAERLASRFAATGGGLEQLFAELRRADVGIASVAVERPLLDRDTLAGCLAGRPGRPLLLIDLGIPRNVDPAANEVDDLYLYDLDDLEGIAARGWALRRDALEPAEAIVTGEVERYERWRQGLMAVPVIRELRERALELAEEEVRRATPRFPDTPEARKALEQLAQALVAKLLHHPLERLRSEAEEGTGRYYGAAIRELFGLEEEE